jgi:hypothetical protein
MKRVKRTTKRERKANDPRFSPGPRTPQQDQHIHCVSCGRHIDASELSSSPATATFISCDHGSRFAACVGCMEDAEARLAEHDRSGEPVKMAPAWH